MKDASLSTARRGATSATRCRPEGAYDYSPTKTSGTPEDPPCTAGTEIRQLCAAEHDPGEGLDDAAGSDVFLSFLLGE